MTTIRRPDTVLGVLGGMGPAAAAEFLRLLAERAPVSSDQEHAITYLLSDPQVPDRSSAILGVGEDPTARLKDDLLTLTRWGATLLAVPCNTAHYFINRFREGLPVPLVHIIEETVKAAAALSPKGTWLTATLGTMGSGLYQKEAERQGYSFFIPPEEAQRQVQRSIELVKSGKKDEGGRLLKGVVEGLWRERDLPVCAACTELPLAYDASGLPQERTVSSLGALCGACLRRIYG